MGAIGAPAAEFTPSANRDEIMRRLADADIPSRQYFTPIHLQPFYQQRFGYQRGDFPVTEHFADTCLALPFSCVMTEDQVDYVCRQLQGCISESLSEGFALDRVA